MVKQALIIGGGYGTRISAANNPSRNKPLIEYAGQTMIGHLIDGLKGGGIERCVIASGYHSNEEIRKIVEGKGINATVVPIEGGFRKIPYYTQDLLDDRFMIVCGHQPLSPNFVRRMLQQAEIYECVITAYDNLTYPCNKSRRLMCMNGSGGAKLKAVDIEAENIDQAHKYARNPYVVGKNMVNLSKKRDFQQTFSYYIFEHWTSGGSLGIIEATMPPEFDYDGEFERTKSFLDSLKAE